MSPESSSPAIPILDGPQSWPEWTKSILIQLERCGHKYTLDQPCPPDLKTTSSFKKTELWQDWCTRQEAGRTEGDSASCRKKDKARWEVEAQLACSEWELHNSRAFLYILDHCSIALGKKIKECGSATEAWAILENLCTGQDDSYGAVKAMKNMTLSNYGRVADYTKAFEDCLKNLKEHKIDQSRYHTQLMYVIGLEEAYPEVKNRLDAMTLMARKNLKLNCVIEMALEAEAQVQVKPKSMAKIEYHEIEMQKSTSNEGLKRKRNKRISSDSDSESTEIRRAFGITEASDRAPKDQAKRSRARRSILQPAYSESDGDQMHSPSVIPHRLRQM